MDKLIVETIKKIAPLDKAAMEAARQRQDTLTKPLGSLGKLEELSLHIAGIKAQPIPKLERKAVIVMAADHGVTAEGISPYPQEVTAQMVLNFLNGGAAINVLARQAGVRVTVVDIGVATPLPSDPKLLSRRVANGTANMTRGPAMSYQQAEQAICTGIEVLEQEWEKGLDIVAIGEMGIGNTTASSAICAVMTGKPVDKTTGRGTGITDEGMARKIDAIKRAIQTNEPNKRDAIHVLSKVGGFEIGGLTGVILGAAAHRIPVVIDGFISGAAALIAVDLSLQTRPYLIASHLSSEAGHHIMLEHLGLHPLVNLGMRLGEGTGAMVGMMLAEAATRTLAEMATFGEAGVSEAE